MLEYILIFLGLIAAIYGASFLVDGGSSLARNLKVSDLTIGLTVVAFGTSMPELTVNLFSSFQGKTEIAIGNILGSNIFNIFFILGVSALIYPLAVINRTVWKDIPYSLLAAIMVLLLTNKFIDSVPSLDMIDGLLLMVIFCLFLLHIYMAAYKKETANLVAIKIRHMSLGKSWLFIIGGLSLLVVGGKFLVSGAVGLARSLGVTESLIGLTIVAAGTSLPELATSTVAAFKKNADIAVGNIVGSNIFNIFFILGISSIIKPLPFTTATGMVDIFMTILASLVLFVMMFTGKKNLIDRWEGVLMIVIYILYVGFLIRVG